MFVSNNKKKDGLTSMMSGYDTKFELSGLVEYPIKLKYTSNRMNRKLKKTYEVVGRSEYECLIKMLSLLRTEVPSDVERFCRGVRMSYKNAWSFGRNEHQNNFSRYRIKATGQECIILNGQKYTPIMIDDSQLEMVGAENRDYTITRTVKESVKIDSLIKHDFVLKESIDIPVGNTVITFVVEHIRGFEEFSDIYFVAKEAVGSVSPNKIKELLDGIESQMPGEILSKMRDISHRTKNDDKEFLRKITIPSIANVNANSDTYVHCYGFDDFAFDGMIRMVDRSKYLLKDVSGKTRKEPASYYVWPRYSNAGTGDLHIVTEVGTVRTDSKNQGHNEPRAVVPMFCLRIMKDKENA